MARVIIPTPGRDVLYRSTTGKYALPAKVSVTLDNLNLEVVSDTLTALDSPLHVHLKVFNPGPEYVELNVPHAAMHPDFDEDLNPWPVRSWVWPPLVRDRVWDTEAYAAFERLPYVWNEG